MAARRLTPTKAGYAGATRRKAYLRLMLRRTRPGRGSSLLLLRSRSSYPMPDLGSLLPGIRYVVVGGMATSLYMPLRTTQDVDILVAAKDVAAVEQALGASGATVLGPHHIDNPLRITGNSWRLSDGTLLDVLSSRRAWVSEALAHPVRDAAGLPIVLLPHLVLMKLASARGIDVGDLTRMLGAASDETLEQVRAVVRKHLPDAVDDVDAFAELGRMELAE